MPTLNKLPIEIGGFKTEFKQSMHYFFEARYSTRFLISFGFRIAPIGGMDEVFILSLNLILLLSIFTNLPETILNVNSSVVSSSNLPEMNSSSLSSIAMVFSAKGQRARPF